MVRLKKLITERTFSIDNDINFIYKRAFKLFFDKVNKNIKDSNSLGEPLKFALARDFPYMNKIINDSSVILKEFSSGELLSDDCKKAHSINPVSIYCGLFPGGSFYSPTEEKIVISPNMAALKIFAQRYENVLNSNSRRSLWNEITEGKIKATISHELSHWISDSFYNKHILKIIGRASELSNSELMKLKKHDVNMTYFEIDAQIHAIKSLKSVYENEWNFMTLDDLFYKSTSLYSIAGKLYRNYGQHILDIWQKALLKRMSRENLLGAKMKSFVRGDKL